MSVPSSAQHKGSQTEQAWGSLYQQLRERSPEEGREGGSSIVLSYLSSFQVSGHIGVFPFLQEGEGVPLPP